MKIGATNPKATAQNQSKGDRSKSILVQLIQRQPLQATAQNQSKINPGINENWCYQSKGDRSKSILVSMKIGATDPGDRSKSIQNQSWYQ
jgi:hypothetical protein